MIKGEELTPIGKLIKPHGIKGEITAALEYDVDLTGLSCIIICVDGIYVPFFINSVRQKGRDSVLVSIDGVRNESEAASFAGSTIYVLKAEMPEDAEDADGVYLSDIVGYTVIDASNGVTVGRITDFDDSTENVVLILTPARKDADTIYIPAADEFFEDVDTDTRTVLMNLPDGLY
ncbi:MAG: ribosome maturation factor RimM [Muribaculaceae bacterium]|nr:ribosome maturation factor RimM [Muribaculaceae bacterium]